VVHNVKPRGEMTPEELERARDRDRLKRRMRGYGTPIHVLPEELAEAKSIVVDCHDRGMSFNDMERQLGVSRHVLADVAADRKKTIDRDNYEAIVKMEFEPPPPGRRNGSRMSSVGAYRRVDALRSLGFPKKFLAEYMGTQHQNIPTGDRHKDHIYFDMYTQIKEMYDKLRDADPADFGIRPIDIVRANRRAERLNLPGPLCWDDDTIDDPDAVPEWTGACGTARGYFLHLKYNIQVRRYPDSAKTPHGKQRREVLCDPCVKARRAQKNGAVTRSWVDEDGIRERVTDGVTYRAISEEFQCSSMTVQRVVNKMKAEGWTPPKCGRRPGKDY
jgi:DNA invertase Pin-like site-specific DNA recombinase